jgi:hypothetical protein
VTGARVEVDGLGRLRRELRKLPEQTSDLKDANARVSQLVAAEAAGRAPQRTGRLAGSVRGNRAVGRATVSAGGAALPYGGPVHYGWPAHGIEPQPFISEAAEDTEPVWLPIYESDVERIVDAFGGTY